MSFVTTCSLIGQYLLASKYHILVLPYRHQFVFVIQMYQQLKHKNSTLPMSLSNCLVYFLEKGDTMNDVNQCSHSNDCLVASTRRHASLMRHFFLTQISKKRHYNMSSENVLFSLRLEHASGDEAQTYPNFPPHAL